MAMLNNQMVYWEICWEYMVFMALCGVLWTYIGNVMETWWDILGIDGIIWKLYILEDYCWNHLLDNEDAKICWCRVPEFWSEAILKIQWKQFILLTVTVSVTVTESVSLVHLISFEWVTINSPKSQLPQKFIVPQQNIICVSQKK